MSRIPYGALYRTYVERCLALGITQSCAEQHATQIIRHITGTTPAQSIARGILALVPEQETQAEAIFARLAAHEPFSYIMGTHPFDTLMLAVRAPVLIPRIETEAWATTLCDELGASVLPADGCLLDLCTGSGCIALLTALRVPGMPVYAVDINPAAVALAQENKQKYRAENMTVRSGDLYAPVANLQGTCIRITANPPYIDPALYTTLEPSVRQWESYEALCAERKGMAVIERIITQAPAFLYTDRTIPAELWIELDIDQYTQAETLAYAVGFSACRPWYDHVGHKRVLIARW
jgi:release factor glutamine methyltransferase